MGATMKELGIDQLTPKQRVNLALEIWESLNDERLAGYLTPDQKATLAHRDAELDANPGMAMTWEQIRSSVETGQ